jgi:hypothetical protein
VEQGCTFVIRVPGIYADIDNTTQFIVNTEINGGKITQGKGVMATFSQTGRSRELQVGETVHIIKIEIKPKDNIIHFELLTTNQTTLTDGVTTRYRAELNFHIPDLATLAKAGQVKAIVDNTLSVPATARAAQTKSVDIGMTPDQVRAVLGDPEKQMNLGQKTIFVYKDVKVIFIDSKTPRCQTCSNPPHSTAPALTALFRLSRCAFRSGRTLATRKNANRSHHRSRTSRTHSHPRILNPRGDRSDCL